MLYGFKTCFSILQFFLLHATVVSKLYADLDDAIHMYQQVACDSCRQKLCHLYQPLEYSIQVSTKHASVEYPLGCGVGCRDGDSL